MYLYHTSPFLKVTNVCLSMSQQMQVTEFKVRTLAHAIAHVIELALVVPEPVRALLQPSHRMFDNLHQRLPILRFLSRTSLHSLPRAALVSAQLPEHTSTKTFVLDVLPFPLRYLLAVVADHFFRGVVIGPTCNIFVIAEGVTAGYGQSTVVVDPSFPTSLADTGKGRSGAFGAGEGATVQGYAEYDLILPHPMRDVVVDCLCSADGWSVQIRLVV